MIAVGLIGWRSLVGQVLIQRMHAEKDLIDCTTSYFSTSQAGTKHQGHLLLDAYDLSKLAKQDVLISAQGSAYTTSVLAKLRAYGWEGYWIDAASFARLHTDSVLTLDPINKSSMIEAMKNGTKNFIGPNCTVSLMLMAISGLLPSKIIKAIQVASYQAISGAGSKAITSLIEQYETLTSPNNASPLEKIQHIEKHLSNDKLAYNLHPWIDSESIDGQTKEEHKAYTETKKILGYPIPIDNTCVRVPSLRCHSQAITLELEETLPIQSIIEKLENHHPWIRIIPNTQEASIQKLGPLAPSSTLSIHVGRIRISPHHPNRLQLFTTADQLLWGAAEPLRRAFCLLKPYITA